MKKASVVLLFFEDINELNKKNYKLLTAKKDIEKHVRETLGK